MRVPLYWSEARVRHRDRRGQVTLRRFGWSDVSAADARAHAEARAADALARHLSGERVAPRERKVPYNGADGLPIREEVVARHGPTVLTRNGYGALCLNTPDVLFVDIDAPEPSAGAGCLLAAVGAVLALCVAAAGFGVLAGLLAAAFAVLAAREFRGAGASWESTVPARAAAFAAERPEWNLRLYRTPAGFRLLALHRTFDPASDEVADVFRRFGADPKYARMCRLQRCFRARVSPKPWRAGVRDHVRPNRGVWPIAPERLAARAAWVARYVEASRDFAACRFVEAFGTGRIDPAADAVRRLHDELCRAESGLPLA